MTDETTEKPKKLSKGERLELFRNRFNALCDELGIQAAAFVLHHPEMGMALPLGRSDAVITLQTMLDKTAMAGFYRDLRQARKKEAWDKRNPASAADADAVKAEVSR